MYQFIIGIAFELTLLVVFTIGFFIMNGNIKMFLGTEDFEEWRMKNGKIIKYICLLTIIMLLASIIAKYMQFTVPSPDMLPT
jgi:hypothetical protein